MRILNTLQKSGMSESLSAYIDMLMSDDAEIVFLYTMCCDLDDYEDAIIGYTLPDDFQYTVYILRVNVSADGRRKAFVFC